MKYKKQPWKGLRSQATLNRGSVDALVKLYIHQLMWSSKVPLPSASGGSSLHSPLRKVDTVETI